MKLFAVFVVLALLSGCAQVQQVETVRISSDVWSEYEIFDGVTVHEDPVIQTEVTTVLLNGAYASVWHSAGLNDGDLNSDFGDEVNLTLGSSGKMGDYPFFYDISYIDINEIGAADEGTVDVWRMRAGISARTEVDRANSFVSSAILQARARVRGDSNGGATLILGVEHWYELGEHFELVHGPSVTADTGSIGFEEIVLGRYEAELVHKVDRMEWRILQLIYKAPLTEARNEQESGWVLGTGLSYAF